MASAGSGYAAEPRRYSEEDRDWGVAPIARLRQPPYHAPTPLQIPGAAVIYTEELRAMLAGPDRPFRISVREVQALEAARKGDAKRARELWGEIAKDPGTPQGAAQRASAMLNLFAATEAK